ncbi:MAG TPA: PIN domain-containing protein [Gemmatimonadales bacterium]|nr:PIN domain-containing protein [Gemmatimonadales bacterium]
MQTFAFLDTNIWVHFRPVEEIDWPRLLGACHVEIVVPRITVQELDKLKDSAPSRRVQDRARRGLKLVERSSITPGEPIRLNVRLRVLTDSVRSDFASLGLDPERADDVLIAAMSAFRSENSSDRVVLFSDDTGARITARQLDFEPMELDEDERLRDADPIEAENQRLRRQVQQLTIRLPVLAVRIQGGQSGGTRLEVPTPAVHSENREDYVNAALASARRLAPEQEAEHKEPQPRPKSASSGKGLDISKLASHWKGISASEYERYQRDRENYLSAVAKHAAGEWRREDVNARSARLPMNLINSGTAVAHDLDVELHIPDGPTVEVWSMTERLPEPVPPTPPRTGFQFLTSGLSTTDISSHGFPRLGYLDDVRFQGDRPNISGASIRKSQSYDVKYEVGRIKHNTTEELGVLKLIFAEPPKSKGLTIEWKIRCENLPEVVEGQLHIVFRGRDFRT